MADGGRLIPAPPETPLAAFLPLLRELGDLKRVRSAAAQGSIAERLFRQAWSALLSGGVPAEVARATTRCALAAARLGDLDAATLSEAGLPPEAIARIEAAAVAEVSGALAPELVDWLAGAGPLSPSSAVPPFVDRLARQPRAGATCPGRGRLMFEPPENHAEHCMVTALNAVVLAPLWDADPAGVFLAALAHHLHNALLPDSGFAGEMLLGEWLVPAMDRATALVLDELPAPLRGEVEQARRILPDAETPGGRAFHAADTLDRVLQMEHHLRAAGTSMDFILREMELVHEGPVKPFQDALLAQAGLAGVSLALHPVLDGIPFLRTGREELAAEALACQESGDEEGALVLLLADQDDWWRGPRADPAALRELVRNRDRLSLREAMALLGWGPVADYFAHRWSDPTFLAGLALVEAHWTAPATSFELACGIGHHLRELARRGVAVTGADVVFAKLWVARHWVCPEAELWCLDAAQPWPELGRYDLVSCHDAFYFLEPKPAILERLRRLVAPGGLLAIGHVHNRDWPNLSAGSAVTAAEMAAMFPDAHLFDDAELTRALAENRAPLPGLSPDAEAFAAVEGRPVPAAFSDGSGSFLADAALPVSGVLALPPEGATLRRNPLYDAGGRIAWPSERYATEYGPRATYPLTSDAPEHATMTEATREQARRRELLDLPERW